MEPFFHPKSIAVIGATETAGSVGRTLMANLNIFPGKLFPVHPKRQHVFGRKCFPSISSIQEPIDLAIVVTPAQTVPGIIGECAKKEIPAGIIISAGFKEVGEEGAKREAEILQVKGNMRLIGPNCLGLMRPKSDLNATFAKGMALSGSSAFISQSGAMCTAVLDWSFKQKFGFSAFVSIGSMADVQFADLITYLGKDPETKTILIYMESVGDGPAFLEAARAVATKKPIIVIKAGRTAQAAKACASHTGSLAGSDEVFDAAMRRFGVLRVETIEDLFHIALTLSLQPIPKGPHLAIITNAGGPAVLATDALVFQGGEITKPGQTSIETLNTFLPAAWSHTNPLDLIGDASAKTYGKTLAVIAEDAAFDGMLVILSPQDMTDPLGTAEEVILHAKKMDKPVLASWMGGQSTELAFQRLMEAGIPTFAFPDSAAKVFAQLWNHTKDLADIYENGKEKTFDADRADAKKIFESVRKEGRTLLSEHEAKRILQAYSIPASPTRIAATREEAIQAAHELGFPAVLKLHSHTITHKSDVGGVKLNLQDDEEVAAAFDMIQKVVSAQDFGGVTVQPMMKFLDSFELIFGSSIDAQFGPVLLFGAGGVFVEVFKDKALTLPPLNTLLARRVMQRTKIYHALHGIRGKAPIDTKKIEELFVRFSQLITDHPFIEECDINPLLVSPEHIVALDARITIR